MLEAIALKLITTLTGYLFENYLDTFKYAKIDGAPSWYAQSSSSENLHGYGFSKGGIESIDKARELCRTDLQNKIQKSIDIIVYDNFRDIADDAEKELVSRFKNDENLPLFVEKETRYEKIEHQNKREDSLFHDAREERTFTGCIIPKKAVVEYQTQRVNKIQKEVSLHRNEGALDSLDKEFL